MVEIFYQLKAGSVEGSDAMEVELAQALLNGYFVVGPEDNVFHRMSSHTNRILPIR